MKNWEKFVKNAHFLRFLVQNWEKIIQFSNFLGFFAHSSRFCFRSGAAGAFKTGRVKIGNLFLV